MVIAILSLFKQVPVILVNQSVELAWHNMPDSMVTTVIVIVINEAVDSMIKGGCK